MFDFENYFDANPTAMLLIDEQNGKIVNANKSASDFYGYNTAELCSLNIFDLSILPLEEKINLFDEVRKKKNASYKLQLQLKDKSIKTVNVLPSLVKIDNSVMILAIIQDITNEIENLKELNKYFKIIDESVAYIGIANKERKVTYLNKSFRKAFGINVHEEISKFETSKFYSNDGAIQTRKNFENAVLTGEPWLCENEMKTLEGTIIPVFQSGIVVKDQNNEIDFTSITALNISQIKVVETELKESEKFYKSLFNHLNGFAYCKMIYNNGKAIDFEYVKVNKAYEEQTGLKNVCGKRVSEVIPGILEKDFSLIKKYADVVETGIPRVFEVYLNSMKIWVNVHVITPHANHFIASIEVITERKEREKKIVDLSNRYKQLFESHSSVMLLIDVDSGNILDVNTSAVNFYGYDKEQLIKMNIADINTLKNEAIKQEMELAVFEKRNYFLYKHKLANGELRDVEVHSIPMIINEKEALFTVIHDITERVKNEQLVNEYTVSLKKMNEDLESFAYVASHDLKAPLNVVNGFLGLINSKKNSLSNESRDEYLRYMQDAVNQMKSLINDLLQFSKIGLNKDSLEMVDVNHLLISIQSILSETIQQNKATITLHPLPTILANKTLLNELFMNLLGNALKYHKAEQEVVIEVGYEETADFHQFFVKDNGIGIATENLGKVFIMFKRLHPQSEFEGTGIGLSLCKRIVETHNGKIWVESVLGEGSTFYFTIKK